MSSLTRWDPIREMTSLRDAMERLVDRAVLGPGFSGGFGSVGNVSSVGLMNVFESGDRYICQVLLPGVSTNDIELTTRQNTLTIKAKLPELYTAESQKEVNYLLREFAPGEFTRSIMLPKDVDGDATQARFEQGVLTVVIPLAQHAQPRRIQISATNGAQQIAEPNHTKVVEEHAVSAN